MKSDPQVVLIMIEGKGVVVGVVVGALLALILVDAITTATASSAVSLLFLLLPVLPEQLVRRVLLLRVVCDDDLFSIHHSQLYNQINLSPLIHPQNIQPR